MDQQNDLGGDWTEEEVNLIVEDYFQMFELELAGQPYNKAQRLRELQPKLRGRSKGSIEFKRMNISAALEELGYGYIDGYKPRYNRQIKLILAVDEFLKGNVSIAEKSKAFVPALVVDEARQSIVDLAKIVVVPKEPNASSNVARSPKSSFGQPRMVDWTAVAELNREKGQRGEEIVLAYERFRLSELGRRDLADQVVWASKAEGDGLGYDIRSFETDGTPRHIEVKSTTEGPNAPIYFTENERMFAFENRNTFYLYRVYHLEKDPKITIHQGCYESFVDLTPAMYQGRFS